MAKISKKDVIMGLPSKEQLMTSPQNTDTIPAQVSGADGAPQGPAALTEGEFVFSLPAIIALGEGDHAQGIQVLTEMHDQLQAVGDQMVSQGAGQPQPQEGGLPSLPQ